MDFFFRWMNLLCILALIFALESSSQSPLCSSVVWIARVTMDNSFSRSFASWTGRNTCKFLKIHPSDVCDGFFDDMFPEIMDALVNGVLVPRKICRYPIQLMDDWTIDIPPSNHSQRQFPSIPPSSKSIPLLHISDLHLDSFYTVASEAGCKHSVCCRNSSNMDDKFIKNPAGIYGEFKCDTSPALMMSLFQYIKSLPQTPKLLYLTGDFATHFVWTQSIESQIQSLSSIMNLFKQMMPDVKIFPTLGNHDSFPANSFPSHRISKLRNISWLYEEAKALWKDYLGEEELKTVSLGGFYTSLVKPGWRVVSLNTNFCDTHNFWMFVDSHDPMDQLKWLVEVLQKAESDGEIVHIIGHHPPYNSDCFETWASQFRRVLLRFSGIISAGFFGHTHADEFQILLNSSSLDPYLVSYVCPSIVPFIGFNPGFRIYKIDDSPSLEYPKTTRMVLDFEVHYLDIMESNREKLPLWRKEYKATEEFNMTDLHPSSWKKIIIDIFTHKSQMERYKLLRTRLHKNDGEDLNICYFITSEKKGSTICEISLNHTDGEVKLQYQSST